MCIYILYGEDVRRCDKGGNKGRRGGDGKVLYFLENRKREIQNMSGLDFI